MTTLHTISKPPSSGLYNSCELMLSAGDCVLFIEDGVYHCIDGQEILNAKNGIKFCALIEDAEARGLKNRLGSFVSSIDTTGFVELCARFDKIVNWF